MNEVNITKYNKKWGHDIVFFGQATVKKGYYFVDGDENFYHFIGKNSVYSMLELLHPDDIKGFLDMLEHLPEGEQCAIVRMKCYNNQYRYLSTTDLRLLPLIFVILWRLRTDMRSISIW